MELSRQQNLFIDEKGLLLPAETNFGLNEQWMLIDPIPDPGIS
jgi:hypothetical protein